MKTSCCPERRRAGMLFVFLARPAVWWERLRPRGRGSGVGEDLVEVSENGTANDTSGSDRAARPGCALDGLILILQVEAGQLSRYAHFRRSAKSFAG